MKKKEKTENPSSNLPLFTEAPWNFVLIHFAFTKENKIIIISYSYSTDTSPKHILLQTNNLLPCPLFPT